MEKACGTTRHCVHHGWCHRCNPRFAVLMNEVNRAVQKVAQGGNWGPLYEELARVLTEGRHSDALQVDLGAEEAVDGPGSGLPAFSGDAAYCIKCGYTGAGTTYRAYGELPDCDDIYAIGDVWPERLERRCMECGYRWNERPNTPSEREGS